MTALHRQNNTTVKTMSKNCEKKESCPTQNTKDKSSFPQQECKKHS